LPSTSICTRAIPLRSAAFAVIFDGALSLPLFFGALLIETDGAVLSTMTSRWR
jgi:hypothetical protein